MATAWAQRRPGPVTWRSNASRTLITGAFVATAAAIALAVAIKAPGYGVAPLAAVPLVALPVWMLITRKHALALAVVLVYMGLADGYLKLRTTSEAPTVGRDLLLYAIAAGMLIRSAVQKKPLQLPPLSGWVIAFTGVVVVQLLNPANQSPLHSVASLRQHIEFVPLFFIAYVLMRNTTRIRTFFLILLGVAAINGVVGLVQVNMTPATLASWGPGYENLLEGNGVAPRTTPGQEEGESIVRPPGLGSDMGFAGTLGVVALPGALALIATRRFAPGQAAAAALLAPLSVVGIVTSQSRGIVVVGALTLVLFILLISFAGQLRRLLVPAATVLVAGIIGVSLVARSSDDGVFQRYESVAPAQLLETTYDSRSGTFELIPELASKYPFGAGIGSVGPASGVFGKPRPLNAESQFTFMIVEIGVLGLLVFMGFQIHLLARFLTRIRTVAPEARVLLVGLMTPLLAFAILWITGVTTTSSPNAPYIWFAAGTAVWWLGRSGTSRAETPTRT